MKTELLDKIFPEDGVKDGVVASFNYNATHSEYLALKDAAEADAAFRATITDLCDRYGMPPGAYPYLYLARRLEERDGTQVSRLADVAANFGIGEGENLADFLLSKCKLVARLEEQLVDMQHSLAEAESNIPDEDEVCACIGDGTTMPDDYLTRKDLDDYWNPISNRIKDLKESVGMIADDVDMTERRVESVRLRLRDLWKRPQFGFVKSYTSALAAAATFAAVQYFIG